MILLCTGSGILSYRSSILTNGMWKATTFAQMSRSDSGTRFNPFSPLTNRGGIKSWHLLVREDIPEEVDGMYTELGPDDEEDDKEDDGWGPEEDPQTRAQHNLLPAPPPLPDIFWLRSGHEKQSHTNRDGRDSWCLKTCVCMMDKNCDVMCTRRANSRFKLSWATEKENVEGSQLLTEREKFNASSHSMSPSCFFVCIFRMLPSANKLPSHVFPSSNWQQQQQ